jgi:hypothetical protein
MTSSIPHSRTLLRGLMVVLAGAALAACETAAVGPTAKDAKPPEPPMTRARAATQCWMSTEKGHADMNLDKRADFVTKCIDQKMKAAAEAPKT